MHGLIWGLRASAVALCFGACAGAAGGALAQDLNDASEPAGVSKLDLSPENGARDVDRAPTGAIARSAAGAARLDLPSSAPDLPPDAPPPSVGAAIDLPDFTPSTPLVQAPSISSTTQLLASPAKTPVADIGTPAAPVFHAGQTPDRSGAASVDPASLAGPIETALDNLVAMKSTSNPIGAGDWRAARRAVRGVYVSRDFLPIWVEPTGGLSASGRALLRGLARAEEDGLDLGAFALPAATFAETAPDRLATAEATLSAAVAAYAMQASGARIGLSAFAPDVTAKPEIANARKALIDVAAASNPGAALAAFNPQQSGYSALREKLADLRDATPRSSVRLGQGPTLKIGMTDPRVPLIRARFGLSAQAIGDVADVYDTRVATAVAAFQHTRGLASNGALTSATAEALYGDPNAAREGLIVANMEMWRWLPHDMGAQRVEVNVADYTLRLMDGETEVHRARVIVGKPDTPTPIFSNAIRYLLVNPIWRVPDSIVKKEMEPHLAKDPNWLTRKGFKVTQVGDRVVVEQPPGEANALGRLLFMFPNEHAVYLHDTPSRGLFSVARRAMSHGCVRVDGPARLAELVMGGAEKGWSQTRVNALIGAKERTVMLPAPLPIHLEYFTEFVDESGTLQDRDDVYGLTARVAMALSRLRQD